MFECYCGCNDLFLILYNHVWPGRPHSHPDQDTSRTTLHTPGLGPGLLSPHQRDFSLHTRGSSFSTRTSLQDTLSIIRDLSRISLQDLSLQDNRALSPGHSLHTLCSTPAVSTLTEEHSKYTPYKEGERSFYAEIICQANNNKGIEIFRKTVSKHLGSDWTETAETGSETD